jgi:hypothetical protein
LKLTIFPSVVVIVFVLLYAQANPVMGKWVGSINLAAIDVFWLFFVAMGSVLTANLIEPTEIPSLVAADQSIPDKMVPPESPTETTNTQQNIQIGVVSLVALNILLVLALITEMIFLTDAQNYPASQLSAAVHQGVYTSIGSIVLAIVLLAFCFRESVSFSAHSHLLKKLAYAWLFLNALLCMSIMAKTYVYILDYGLTIKREGVVAYALLCLVGLTTTAIKIAHHKSLAFLWRQNLMAASIVFVVFSWVNWGGVNSSYNLVHGYSYPFSRDLPQNLPVLIGQSHLLDSNLPNQKDWLENAQSEVKEMNERDWQERNIQQLRLQNEYGMIELPKSN